MPSYLFWLFSTIMLIGGAAVIAFRNPVSSALSMVTCFVGLAGLFIGLSAFFVGIIQILVYTGAVMVLFLFIIMLNTCSLSDDIEDAIRGREAAEAPPAATAQPVPAPVTAPTAEEPA